MKIFAVHFLYPFSIADMKHACTCLVRISTKLVEVVSLLLLVVMIMVALATPFAAPLKRRKLSTRWRRMMNVTLATLTMTKMKLIQMLDPWTGSAHYLVTTT